MRFSSLLLLAPACISQLLEHSSFAANSSSEVPGQPLPKVLVPKDSCTFVTEAGQPFVPFGVNYYRPGTGWAPQIWKQFDPEATRKDFARMKELGVNCVRIFLPIILSIPIPES